MYHQVKRSWLLSAPCICADFYVIQAFKVAVDTLVSLLRIYLKPMHEEQRLISTGLRDIQNWIEMSA